MAKSDKESKGSKKIVPKKNIATPQEPGVSKPIDDDEDGLDDEAESRPVKKLSKGPKSLAEDDDEEIVDDEEIDQPVAGEDDDWDPDFDEFDLPKSKTGKKIIGPKKSVKDDDDDDFKVDEEFKDMMGGGGSSKRGFDDDDDF
jgi:nucleolin